MSDALFIQTLVVSSMQELLCSSKSPGLKGKHALGAYFTGSQHLQS